MTHSQIEEDVKELVYIVAAGELRNYQLESMVKNIVDYIENTVIKDDKNWKGQP